jgi:hypothetical protein
MPLAAETLESRAMLASLTGSDPLAPPPSDPVTLPRPTTLSAFDLDGNGSEPVFEEVANAFDNDRSTKYLNRGGVNSGIEFSYAVPTRLSAFIITTANDVPDRDPTAYRIEGLNAGSWQTLHVGGLALPTARLTDSAPVTLPELPLFTQYRIVFTALRGSGHMMQITDLKLLGSQSTQPEPVPPALPPSNTSTLPQTSTTTAFALLGGSSSASNITALPGYGVATSALFNFSGGGWAGWSVPDGKVVLGAKIISAGDSIADFSVFKAAGPDEVYPHWTYGPAEYGWVMEAKQANYGVQIEVYYADPPTINVQVSPASVAEDGPDKLTYTFTATGPLTRDVTVNYSVGGSATAGSDFTGLPAGASTGAITIPANATTASVTVHPTPDSEIEDDETVVLTLLPGAGYALGTRTAATGTIINDDLPGTVTGQAWFDANDDGSYSASESPLSAIIVNLFDSLGSPALDASLQPVAPTTIDAGATYQFPNLRPGSYTVSFTDTLGYLGPGTAGAVYAGIAIIQLAQTAIVDLLFSQVVIPGEPPAPPAPPTADTLDWKDFKEVDKSPDPKHPDRVAYTGWNDTIGEYESGEATIVYGPLNGPFTAKVTLPLNMAPSFTAVFDKAKSWVVKGKQTPQLLEHERLHLRIAEYIAKKAALNFPANMKGVGEAQGNTKIEAATKARDAAWDNDLVPRVDAFLAEWERIEKTITDLYDSKTETDHGRNPDQQAKWERDWQQLVDAELTKQGWKVQ